MALTEPGRYGDGDGLYLNIAPSGSKTWVRGTAIDESRRDIGLRSFSAASLAQARSNAVASRSAFSAGRDPVAEKYETRAAVHNSVTSTPTFAEAARHVIGLRRPTWSNPRHAAQW